ncbi:MAG TPA: HD-GYP domain-containing protein, partial [Vicinamibacterales bacterium]
IQLLHALNPSVTIGIVGDQIVVDDTPMTRVDALGALVKRLQQAGVERVVIDRGVLPDELKALVEAVSASEASGTSGALPTLPHIRVGRVTTEQQAEGSPTDMATMKQLYNEAVSAAGSIWDSAQTEGTPDVGVARTMIDGLAQAVAQNRTALLALTTLKNYDNYTFTHMINVSILTMGQARGLGIEGARLRELGMAALMHDIGKVRTPLEVLNKPDKLTPDEFAIMKRHTVDGAEMLRKTTEVPPLAPVIAFEHHLRTDGTGYPDGISRSSLNVGTMLCSIADVYDAMRSRRVYQDMLPSERVLEVLKRSDGKQFDQHLVRRFVQLVGIYPAGNLVKINTGEIAVVRQVYAPDPHRPQVRVIFDRDGKRLDPTYDVNLWVTAEAGAGPSSVIAPVDPAGYDLDPLMIM